jgi:class 3 adenylate cyclase
MSTEIRYARAADGTHVAYQVTGDGPIDLLLMRAWHSHLEHEWEEPVLAGIFRRLGSLGRLIRLDRRGTGLSDRFDPSELPTLEARVDDIRAVLDAAGSDRVVAIGLAHAGALCSYFAATHPERTAGLIIYGPVPQMFGSEDPPGGLPIGRDDFLRTWGTTEGAREVVEFAAPSRRDDEGLVTWIRDDERLSGTAEEGFAQWELVTQTNVSGILPSIHVPTLIVARSESPWQPFPSDAIPHARLVEVPGRDHALLSGDWRSPLAAFETFIDSLGHTQPELDRVLATVMFTDIVGSTEHAARVGDREWAAVLERHHATVRRQLGRHRGREIDTAGDGFFAAFDGPARAIHCAVSIRDALSELGIGLRIGLHSGECERVDGGLRGVAVHVGARIGATAEPGEVLVSSTVRDLVAGSGITFEDAGIRELKGVPDAWHVYRVADVGRSTAGPSS